MKSKKIQFRMHAWSDAAGKYNPEAVRDGNEDNFYVDDDLGDGLPGHCESDIIKTMGDYGLIMAVADGMGGMNAGEVASEIAVQTIQDFFSPGRIGADMVKSQAKRKKYLEELIVEADRRIKTQARNNPGQEGMGSTIILAWIVGNQLTLSWCGDSRAYRFNPRTGIELISEDHSYVQDLVRQGVLTYEQTFEHPQGNIITRSLGDESKKSQPETRFFQLHDHDIILLCSDGLSGVLRDRKTPDGEGGFYPGDNLEDLIRDNRDTLSGCRQALWDAAEQADWYDNVTAILCEIVSGAGAAPELSDKSGADGNSRPFWNRTVIRLSPKRLIFIILAILLAGVCAVGVWKFRDKICPQPEPEPVINTGDDQTTPPDDNPDTTTNTGNPPSGQTKGGESDQGQNGKTGDKGTSDQPDAEDKKNENKGASRAGTGTGTDKNPGLKEIKTSLDGSQGTSNVLTPAQQDSPDTSKKDSETLIMAPREKKDSTKTDSTDMKESTDTTNIPEQMPSQNNQ